MSLWLLTHNTVSAVCRSIPSQTGPAPSPAEPAASGGPVGIEQPEVILPRLFDRFDALAHPDNLIHVLQQTTWVVGMIFLVVGLTCMLQGYKLYKGVVIITALLLGAIVGYKLGQSIQAEVIVAGCLGVLLAVVAWPFMKFAVAACGALAGAFIGANAWSAIANHINAASEAASLDPNAYWAGALVGLVLFGLLSFILFELSVVVFTSFSGSVLAVLGVITLLLQVPAWRESVAASIQANPLIMPMLVIVPAVIGLVLQQQFGGLQRHQAEAG